MPYDNYPPTSGDYGDFVVHLSTRALDRLAELGGALEERECQETGHPAAPSPGAMCTTMVTHLLTETPMDALVELLWNRLQTSRRPRRVQ